MKSVYRSMKYAKGMSNKCLHYFNELFWMSSHIKNKAKQNGTKVGT